MTEEPKKISFGFSKVSKKNSILQPKKQNEDKKDIQFIECLEGKSIKLVNGQDKEIKDLPIIPMLNGNLLRDNIKEVIKSREENKEIDGANINNKELTLDELAAKEILEGLKKNENEDDEKSSQLTVNLSTQISLNNQEPSSLEDYESMPISDFGLAMLRGMGWNPKKGIGLNGKIVSPLAPTLRPKGMGLGADKTPAAKNIVSNGEVLVMKKGAAVKIVSGLHNNLYGRIEGFDELPGRLMVRISANNIVVSLNEIMVQLVSTNEFNKNIENNKFKIETEAEQDQNKLKSEKRRINNAHEFELISTDNCREPKLKEKFNGGSKNCEVEKSLHSSEDRSKKYSNHHKKNREENRHRSRSPKYQKHFSERKTYGTESKHNRYKDFKESRKHRRKSSSSASSVDSKEDSKFNRRIRDESNSSDSEIDQRKNSFTSKQYRSHGSSKRSSHAKEEIKYSSKYKTHRKR